MIYGTYPEHSRFIIPSNIFDHVGLQCSLFGNCCADSAASSKISRNCFRVRWAPGQKTEQTIEFDQKHAGHRNLQLFIGRYYHGLDLSRALHLGKCCFWHKFIGFNDFIDFELNRSTAFYKSPCNSIEEYGIITPLSHHFQGCFFPPFGGKKKIDFPSFLWQLNIRVLRKVFFRSMFSFF